MKTISLSWARRLQRELNSEAFISGLEAVIDFTCKHGNESSFGVKYCQEINSFAYPEHITVGTKKAVSDYIPLNLANINEAYKRQTGLPFPNPKNKEWVRRAKKLGEQQRLKERLDCIHFESILRIINPSLTLQLNYPSTKDKAKKDYGWTMNRLEKQRGVSTTEQLDALYAQYVTLIAVHTHPNRGVAPSTCDLRYLNSLRLYKSHKHLNSKLTVPNPIMIIAGAQNNDRQKLEYPLLIIQERTKEPLPLDTYSKIFVYLMYYFQKGTSPEEKLMQSIFPKRYEQEVKKYYNLLHATYSRSEQNIKIRKSERWKVLCERV